MSTSRTIQTVFRSASSLWSRVRRARGDRSKDITGNATLGATEPAEPELGIETVEFLGDLASDSFKRQIELDESIWRSLPFFAATFAFVATVIGRSATDSPQWGWSPYPIATAVMLGLSVAGLAWSLRWFWIVLKPREYEYPSSDAQVQQYGRDMLSYHAASGVTESDLDARTVRELRLFMMEQYGNAAAANLVHNATKLKARSKTLFFMLTAFVLAFACEATIFLHRQFGETSAVEGSRTDESENTERHPDGQTQPGKSIASTPDAAPAAVSQGRREFLGRKFATGNQEQAVTRDRPNTSTPKPGSAAPMRPTPPSPIVVMKDRAVDLGNTKTQPKPTTKPDHR